MVKTAGTKLSGMDDYEYVLSMEDQLEQYVHNWIAVVDSKVVSSGKDAKTVYNEAKKAYPTKTPLIMKVPADEVMLL